MAGHVSVVERISLGAAGDEPVMHAADCPSQARGVVARTVDLAWPGRVNDP